MSSAPFLVHKFFKFTRLDLSLIFSIGECVCIHCHIDQLPTVECPQHSLFKTFQLESYLHNYIFKVHRNLQDVKFISFLSLAATEIGGHFFLPERRSSFVFCLFVFVCVVFVFFKVISVPDVGLKLTTP